MRLVFTTLLIILTLNVSGQIVISGNVFAKEDGSPLPGANIHVKGTQNGTAANMEGQFSLAINELPTTLIISFMGMIPQEIKVTNVDVLTIKLQSDCYRDIFDHQLIKIYLNSGIINNPFGGEFRLSFPAFWRSTTLQGKIGYQSDFKKNEFINAQIAFDHIIFKCDFDLDLKADYQQASWKDEIGFDSYSMEAHLNLSKSLTKLSYLRFILGFTRLNFSNVESYKSFSDNGPIVGLGTRIGGSIDALIIGRLFIYKDLIQYQGEITREFKRFDTFVRFNKLNSFAELSLGIGTGIGYRLKGSPQGSMIHSVQPKGKR